jgi:hypothetical protein
MRSEERESLKAAIEARITDVTPCLDEDRILAFYSGRLGESEAEQMRDHLVECPKCLEVARDARQFLKAMSEPVPTAAAIAQLEPAMPVGNRSRQTPWRQSLLHRFQSPVVVFSIAMAALLLAIGCSFLIARTWRLQNQIERMDAAQTQYRQQEQELRQRLAEQARDKNLAEELQREMEKELAALKTEQIEGHKTAIARPVIASLVLLPGFRDLGETPGSNRLIIPPSSDLIRLQANLEVDEHPSYRATLQTADGELVWTQSGLKAQSNGSGKTVVLHLPPKLFAKRDYMLSLSGATAEGKSEDVEQYSFRVVKR